MKLSATVRQQGAIQNNIGNANSFLQTQDGVLATVGKVLNRISELKTLAQDPTKNSSDLANYNAEFTQLQLEITSLGNEKFNGISLFGSAGLNVGVAANASAGSSVNVGTAALMGSTATPLFSDNFANLSNWTTATGSPSVSGNQLTLASGAQLFTNQNFSGALQVTFNLQLGGANSQLILGYVGGGNASDLSFGGLINDTAVHTVKVTFDGAGNSATYLDGSSTSAQTQSGLIDGAGLALENLASTNSAKVSNFAVAAGSGTPTNVSNVTTASSLSAVSLSTVTSAIQEIASFRASNGADQSRLGFASDVLTTNKANLESANSRIVDVDVAAESTQLARYNVLVQAGTAMLSQANQSSQTALKLLG